jgi:hypothetical protein
MAKSAMEDAIKYSIESKDAIRTHGGFDMARKIAVALRGTDPCPLPRPRPRPHPAVCVGNVIDSVMTTMQARDASRSTRGCRCTFTKLTGSASRSC